MPNSFARTTVLHDVCGRVDYISNHKRQEELLAFYDSTTALLGGQFWETLAAESQQAFATYRHNDSRCREGREIITLLSNSLLERMEAEEVARVIAEAFQKNLGLNAAVAVHFNKGKQSLHAHIVFSERQLLEEPVIKIAERNLFFNAEGRRVYKKSEILDEEKRLLPGCSIIQKGEVYEQRYFSSVDTTIKQRDWLVAAKKEILRLRNEELKGDVEITEYDPSTGKLPHIYIGNKVLGAAKARMERDNRLISEFNALVDAGTVTLLEALEIQRRFNQEQEKGFFLALQLKEIRRRKKEELLAAAKKKRAQEYYSRPDFWNSKYNRPYRVGLYDKFGRKRTIIELLVMLAIKVVKGESERWLGGQDEPAPEQRRTIVATRDWKLQQMIDTISIANSEGVRNLGEVEERLQKVGADLSRAKAELQRMSRSNEKVAVLVQAIQEQEQLKEQCEKIYAMPAGLEKNIAEAENDAILKRYSEAKRIVYQNGLEAPEARQDLLSRHSEFDLQLREVEKNIEELKQQYSRLSKLRYNILLAQNKQYCYGPEYKEPEQEPKQEPGQEQSAQDGYTDFADLVAAAESRKALEAREKETQHRQSSGYDDYDDFDSL